MLISANKLTYAIIALTNCFPTLLYNKNQTIEITSKTETGRRELWDVNLILKNNSSEVNLLTASTKNINDILILNKYVRPTALDRWQGIYWIEDISTNYVIFVQEKLNCKSSI